MTPAGFPHSDIHGSKLESSSPWLFAGFRVLHRLLMPRHPPCALCSLTCMRAFGRAGPVNHSRTDGSSSRFLTSPRTLQLPFTAWLLSQTATLESHPRSGEAAKDLDSFVVRRSQTRRPGGRRTDGNVLLGWIGRLQTLPSQWCSCQPFRWSCSSIQMSGSSPVDERSLKTREEGTTNSYGGSAPAS